MNYKLNYQPIKVFNYFEEISAIPRGSGNEKGIADYICRFAEERGLEYYRDDLHNVAVFKPAAKGMEDKEKIMLQGHTDMVCEKNAGTEHDFLTDGIDIIEENGWLRANGTTLGGDDGAAVAMMLAVLDSDDIAHPALECLFTVQEETGLGGATYFDYSKLSAKRIINLDTELEGEAIASCAGSMNTSFTLNAEEVDFANSALKITVKGLAGGHSGTDINSGRMNANLVMGRVLAALYEDCEFNLVSLSGGNKRNAIPRECEAVVSVLERERATEVILNCEKNIRKELNDDDREFRILVSKCGKKEKMVTFKDTSRIISYLSLVPNGVLSMSQSKEGLVESSSNMGVIVNEGNKYTFFAYSRSSVEPVMDNIFIKMKRLAKVLGFEFNLEDRCPGWAFNKNSKLQKDYVEVYKATFGEDTNPRVEAIHAGLECGIIIEKMGGGDAIAIGPNMKDIHTPKEMLEIASMERTWLFLRNLLAK